MRDASCVNQERRSQVSKDRDSAGQLDPRVGAYWLAHAEGFHVQSNIGRLGIVEEVRVDDTGNLASLLVRGGVLGNRTRVLEAAAVRAINPRRLWIDVEIGAEGTAATPQPAYRLWRRLRSA